MSTPGGRSAADVMALYLPCKIEETVIRGARFTIKHKKNECAELAGRRKD